MESKKISFGFKLAAKPSLLPVKQKEALKETKELIKCLEGQEIKLLDEKKDKAPLVIPMIGTQKTSAALASLMKRRAVLLGEDEKAEQESTQPNIDDLSNKDNEDLDKRAARELLAQLHSTNGEANDHDKLVLPILKADDLPLDGAKEATIEDYDSIPIQQFGLAMLRGMGWIEPPKKKGGLPADDAPFLRPKGMGLGADKALKAKPLLIQPAANEILEIKKLAYVRILGGKHKDAYGQIEGFDDHAGRVIVKMAIGSSKETFNEFMCLPVSKKEFTDYGKCINTTKYEKYKKLENEHGQIIVESGKTSYANRTSKDGSIMDKDLDTKHRSTRKYEDERKKYMDEQHRRSYKNEENIQSRRDAQSTNRIRNGNSRSSSVKRYRAEQKNEDKKIRSSRSPVRHLKSEAKAHRESRLSSSIKESTDYSNSTKSDTDSVYERKHKKQSSTKSKKRKSKKSKSKNRHRQSDSSIGDHGSYISDSDKNEREHSISKHKKKSKKSKRARSRSRSQSRRLK